MRKDKNKKLQESRADENGGEEELQKLKIDKDDGEEKQKTSKKEHLSLAMIPRHRQSKERYAPWRIKDGQTSKKQSILAIVLLIVMFVGSYGVGWLIGRGLHNQIERANHQEEVAESQEGQDGDTKEENVKDEGSNEDDNNQDDDGDGDGDGELNDQEPSENDLAETEGESVKSIENETSSAIPKPDITGKKLIALTFDDGPSGAVTDQLLTYLRQKQVRATFFVLGYMVERSPGQIQKEVSEGHEVGSHTTGHTAFSRMSAADLANDTLRMNQLFVNAFGHNTPFMRPPYGDGAYTEKARTNIGQPMILWTVDTLDWKYRDVATVRQNAVKDAFDGAIILFHDIYPTTVDAIPLIIDDLRAQGYEFLTVSELAAARGVIMQNGAVYGSFVPH